MKHALRKHLKLKRKAMTAAVFHGWSVRPPTRGEKAYIFYRGHDHTLLVDSLDPRYQVWKGKSRPKVIAIIHSDGKVEHFDLRARRRAFPHVKNLHAKMKKIAKKELTRRRRFSTSHGAARITRRR
jgi:hypothetical protein